MNSVYRYKGSGKMKSNKNILTCLVLSFFPPNFLLWNISNIYKSKENYIINIHCLGLPASTIITYSQSCLPYTPNHSRPCLLPSHSFEANARHEIIPSIDISVHVSKRRGLLLKDRTTIPLSYQKIIPQHCPISSQSLHFTNFL